MLLSDVTTGGCYNRKLLLLLSCPAEQLLQSSKCRPLRKEHSRCQTGKMQKVRIKGKHEIASQMQSCLLLPSLTCENGIFVVLFCHKSLSSALAEQFWSLLGIAVGRTSFPAL